MRTIFVNKGSKSSVLYQHPPLVTTDPDLNSTKVAIPRLRVQKKAKKPRKTYVRKKPFKSKKSTVSLKPAEGSSDHNESSETIFSDDILTNNEEMEIIEETIKEDTEQTEKIALSKEKRKSGGIVSEEDKKKLEGFSKKKSKSSYSIAALCQISVNIGDNRPEVAQSPGMMSLNSVGTISPAHTPGPPDRGQTMEVSGCIVIDPATGTATVPASLEVEETVIEELRTIRPEDLQQIEVVTTSAAGTAANMSPSSQTFLSNYPAASSKPPPAPAAVTVVVEQCDNKTIQRDIYQVIKDLDHELDLEKEKQVAVNPTQVIPVSKPSLPAKTSAATVQKEPHPRTKVPVTVSKTTAQMKLTSVSLNRPGAVTTTSPGSVSTVTTAAGSVKVSSSAALSVYDFQASKPETPPLPLQESRKDLKAVASGKTQQQQQQQVQESGKVFSSHASTSNTQKKTYTELQSKAKKAAQVEDTSPSKKYKEAVGGGGHQMASSVQPHSSSGYLQTSFMEPPAGYHQQQPPDMQRQRGNYGSASASSYPASCRHSYMAPGYPYQVAAGSSQHQPHPYHHYNHAEAGKYPGCSAHGSGSYSEFHPRSYSSYPGSGGKNYPNPGNQAAPASGGSYRSFHAELGVEGGGGQHYGDRKRPSQQMEIVSQPVMSSTASGTFSVTHLVNTNQRKGTKRSSSSATKATKAAKGEPGKEAKVEKEEAKRAGGRSGSSRRNKSGPGGRSNTSNYSAESLISGPGSLASTQPTLAMAQEPGPDKAGHKMGATSSPAKNSSPAKASSSNYASSIKTAANWSNDVNHFSGLQLSSPSPASILPTDLSSIDFQMSIFGQPEPSLNTKDYLQTSGAASSTSSSQNTKAGTKQQSACQLASNQRAAVPDWGLNTAILNDGFPGIPMPILTPPNDPMTGYPFMSDPMSHSSGWYPCSAASQTSSRIQNQSVSYSASHPSYSQTKAGHQMPPPVSQMAVSLPPLTGPNPLQNFNLSTIFPDLSTITGPAGVAAGQNNCQVRGQVTGAAPDLLPHSFALLGHSAQVMPPTFSVASNMAPPSLPFTNE